MIGPFLRREGQSAPARGPALGLIEVASIARGWVVTDAAAKRAPCEVVLSRTVSPGKHLTLLSGDVDDVEESMRAGIEAAGNALVDRLELPQAADELLRAFKRGLAVLADDRSVGIVETSTVATTLLCADAACKAAQVILHELHLADGLGGKAYFILSGEQGDVEAALFAAETIAKPELFLARELIARPHEDLIAQLRL